MTFLASMLTAPQTITHIHSPAMLQNCQRAHLFFDKSHERHLVKQKRHG